MRVSTQELSAQDIEVLPVREALQVNSFNNLITTINAAVAIPQGAGDASANASQTSVVLLGGGAGTGAAGMSDDY
ncbi:hypothetical protein FNH05_14105 [Amycolatopsis rhizosphaerae]|uniref:Uncharacterized protein n=1 Tax=Amycolatopsis rhizosphaerae TaxID=2053003 RepID=A0A558CT08_9PSEU|nr:hypothetical protein [Amycolatopsis rhizosphaerae]TVT51822.1 hypothetical protein FNH05_14105 [Amycolatopsis rhizosphaerae]